MSIHRGNPFRHEYGDMNENLFSFMLDELNDDADTLRKRLYEINANLKEEMNKLAKQIGGFCPQQTSNFNAMADQLERNTMARVSETISARRSLSGHSKENPRDGTSVNPSEERKGSEVAMMAFGDDQEEEDIFSLQSLSRPSK